jgi:ABC-type cobalamin/Fe3+-siderophores transport system ATPase subunit
MEKGEVLAYANPEDLVNSGLIEKVFGVAFTKVPGKEDALYLFS